ncbi:hypothetical protein CERSUDRAFT_76488 [Gelatoporia subvermispora B]|uniref:Zn(2)-C6 fungal-type domain-containing protein n=1 Tax=Ceriporiopsis subvermispora (strain B) TaxID=914234 RepID=M2R6H9_CERS8|nr:hypothetical protein CERSUDRAFT_76488 [Gelatoporia subvermispora B]
MSFDFSLYMSAPAYYTPPNAGEYDILPEVYTALDILPSAPGGQSEPPIFLTPTYDFAWDDIFGSDQFGTEQIAPSQPDWAPFGEAGDGIHLGIYGDGSGEQQSLFALDLFPSFEPVGTLDAPSGVRAVCRLGFDAGMEGVGGMPIASRLQGRRPPLLAPQYGDGQGYNAPDPFAAQPADPDPDPDPASNLSTGPFVPGVQYHGGGIFSRRNEDLPLYSSGIAPYALNSSPADLTTNAATASFDQISLEDYPYAGLEQLFRDPSYMGPSYPTQTTMYNYHQLTHVPQTPMLELAQYTQLSDQPLQAVTHMGSRSRSGSQSSTLTYGTAEFDLPLPAQVAAPPLMPTARANVVATATRGASKRCTGKGCAGAEAGPEAPPKRKRARRQRQVSTQRVEQAPCTEAPYPATPTSGECSASPTISASSSSTTGLSTSTDGSSVTPSAALVNDDTSDESNAVPGLDVDWDTLVDVHKASSTLRLSACEHCTARKRKCDRSSEKEPCSSCLANGMLCQDRADCGSNLVHQRNQFSCTECRKEVQEQRSRLYVHKEPSEAWHRADE